jgi:hypothetical protein
VPQVHRAQGHDAGGAETHTVRRLPRARSCCETPEARSVNVPLIVAATATVASIIAAIFCAHVGA